MENLLKIYLPILTLLTFGLIFIWSSIRVYRQTGINPMRFDKKDNAHNYVGKVMKILIALLFISVFQFAFSLHYEWLLPIWYLEKTTLDIIGLILIHAALLWILWAQAGMGKSWRIGIDTDNKTSLVTSGMFGLSRNPIFLGMMTALAGYFLVIPNILTFTVLLTGYIVISIQIRLEEEYLLEQHGTAYTAYKNKVRRWI